MKVTFENPDKVNGLMTLTVEEADYKAEVEKELKNYRKRAQVPGFRPGMVPMGMIKRQYGTAVKVDVINKVMGQEMYKYINDNHIHMLGEPLPSDKQVSVDVEAEAPYTFVFDVAVAPEFKIELTDKDKIEYDEIEVDDKLIDQQVQAYAQRAGNYEKAETYEANDLLKGDLRQLDAEGNTLEGGITVESALVMPEYIKAEDQKKIFEGCKLGDILTFNPRKAYESNAELKGLFKMDDAEEAGKVESDFSYQVTEISRFTPAKVDQKLFDQVFGEGNCADEKAFREKIAEGLKTTMVGNSDFKFLQDVRRYCEQKVGEQTYPTELLKRIMKNNNRDKGDDYVEKNFDLSIKELNWHLIKEQLVEANQIKIDDDDIKHTAMEAARAQFAQYGMSNVPDEYLENYAQDMLKKREMVDNFVDRCVDQKLTEVLKNVVTLDRKTISLDDFNKAMQGA